MFVQCADHLQGQIALAAQDLRSLGSASEDWGQVTLTHSELLHAEFDRFYGIGRIHWKTPIFVDLDESCEHVELVMAGKSVAQPQEVEVQREGKRSPSVWPVRFGRGR